MDERTWTSDRLDSLPAWTLVRAYHAVAHGFTELFEQHGLTPVQFGVLAQLAAGPDLLQSELARRVLVRPQSMAAVITQLVQRGLLERRGEGGRGRPVPIRLTAAGRRTLELAGSSVLEFNDPARLGLEPYEAGMLNALLHKLIGSRA
ncbi:MarR family winged helix-turn-helix transcriptional regulator [Nocardia sp. NPDC006044]|uniref:MarR family winged helix-turn-helix transcriptional regulator n=1 Tax=Nocardia sp. NPDC006044 TaxID=3364306 RepID=UPI0036874438